MHTHPKHAGWIEVITGCMFSGKTEELVRRLRRAEYAKQTIRVFKPALDNRYSETQVASHDGVTAEAIAVSSPVEIWDQSQDAQVVGIDEAQFYDEALIEVVQKLAKSGKRVIVSALDMDYRGKPFGVTPQLLAIAEKVDKIQAVCVQCGAHATRSQRIVDSQEQVLVGASSAYEARCRSCWDPEPVFTRFEDIGEMDG